VCRGNPGDFGIRRKMLHDAALQIFKAGSDRSDLPRYMILR
jgi:hypothetical protein